jgi:hypothetical protein
MKGKTLLSLAIALAMVLSAMPLVAVRASPTATMEIVFDGGSHEITYDPCTNFIATIVIRDAPAITQWIATITWDPDVLELETGAAADVVEGPFLKGFGGTVWLVQAPQIGRLPELSCAFMTGGPASGTGNASYIHFHCKGVGDSAIHFEAAYLLNGLNMVDVVPVDGLVHQPPLPPTAPQAKFTPLHCKMVYVCDWITLDGTGSTPGWDTLPDPGNNCPIIDWMWTIDFKNGTIIELHGDYIPDAFHCDRPGDVDITLTVSAPDPILPTHPDYVPTDSETHTIHQITRPVGVVIDVWTEKGGEGPGINPDTGIQFEYPTDWSDAFAPQEEVTVYAKVTYNDDPVQNKPVAFEVKDETGEAVLFRTAFTNASGVAKITFRLIWECDKIFAGKFEVWEIWATVSVSEIEKKDVVKFRYGWLVQIDEITAPGTAHKCEYIPIIVDLNNICFTDKTVFVTVVIYDDCGVPIGIDTLAGWTVFADDGLTPEFTIHIPKWAYLGTGTIYVNVYTAAPQACGVPVCPEGSAIIILAKP